MRYGTCQAAAWERLALLLAVESAAETPSLSLHPSACVAALALSPPRDPRTALPAVAPRVYSRGAVSSHLLFCDYFIFHLACRLVPSSCRLPSAHLVTHPIRTPSPSSLAATQPSQPRHRPRSRSLPYTFRTSLDSPHARLPPQPPTNPCFRLRQPRHPFPRPASSAMPRMSATRCYAPPRRTPPSGIASLRAPRWLGPPSCLTSRPTNASYRGYRCSSGLDTPASARPRTHSSPLHTCPSGISSPITSAPWPTPMPGSPTSGPTAPQPTAPLTRRTSPPPRAPPAARPALTPPTRSSSERSTSPAETADGAQPTRAFELGKPSRKTRASQWRARWRHTPRSALVSTRNSSPCASYARSSRSVGSNPALPPATGRPCKDGTPASSASKSAPASRWSASRRC